MANCLLKIPVSIAGFDKPGREFNNYAALHHNV